MFTCANFSSIASCGGGEASCCYSRNVLETDTIKFKGYLTRCKRSQLSLANRRSFKDHLGQVHSIYQSAPQESSLDSVIDNPNNYRRSCQKTHSSRSRYRQHLCQAHQMTPPSMNVAGNSGDLPDPYNLHSHCSVCKKPWKTRARYRDHCKRARFMEWSHRCIFNPNATINLDDLNFYCAQCQHALSGKLAFRRHLKSVHQITHIWQPTDSNKIK